MRFLWLAPTVVVVLLAGCAWFPFLRPTPPAPAPAPQPPTTTPQSVVIVPKAPEVEPKLSLLAEQRRLADLFRGTPVVFEMTPDGSLRVGVPLRFSFDDGRAAVKPPLAAVLDRVAKSQRGQKTRLRVVAPADSSKVNPQLAKERAASTRDYLVARGVRMSRFAALTPGNGGEVEIIVAESKPQ
jgi:outer membrane protein OmpA-like peptidoglycan-associated protein